MSDPKTLEYYFDFSSPYGYLGTLFVEQLAQDIGRELVWKPYLMGAAMKITGLPTLNKIPLKSDYMWVDLKRYSDQFNVTMRTPNGFPFMSVAACRAHYALLAKDLALAGRWCVAAAKAAWEGGQDLSDMNILAGVASSLGIDPAELGVMIQEQMVKDRLRMETEGAIERGLWGSPHFIVDGKDMFWGCDKRYEIKAIYG